MTIGRPFIERIKWLCRVLIHDRHVVLNRARSHDLEVRLPSMLRRGRQSPFSGPQAIKLLARTDAAPRLSTRADPIPRKSRGGGQGMEHTHSNLG